MKCGDCPESFNCSYRGYLSSGKCGVELELVLKEGLVMVYRQRLAERDRLIEECASEKNEGATWPGRMK